MNLESQIAQYLEDQGVGTVDTDIFVSKLPSEPNDCLVVYRTGGQEPDKELNNQNPTFQILVRNKKYDLGLAKAEAVVAALHQKANLELVGGESYFYYVFLMGEILPLGMDDQERREFSINFETKVRAR